jgi:hypothetical protein
MRRDRQEPEPPRCKARRTARAGEDEMLSKKKKKEKKPGSMNEACSNKLIAVHQLLAD